MDRVKIRFRIRLAGTPVNRVKPRMSISTKGTSLYVETVSASDNKAWVSRISRENEPVSDSRMVKVMGDTPEGSQEGATRSLEDRWSWIKEVTILVGALREQSSHTLW